GPDYQRTVGMENVVTCAGGVSRLVAFDEAEAAEKLFPRSLFSPPTLRGGAACRDAKISSPQKTAPVRAGLAARNDLRHAKSLAHDLWEVSGGDIPAGSGRPGFRSAARGFRRLPRRLREWW